MRIHIELTGKTPLMMHNERLSDPDDEYTKQIKELTAKKTGKTEKDNELISKLEWRGGIYEDGKGNVVVPTKNILKCFREAAAVTKSGRKIARGLSPFELMAALIIDGPRHIDKLIDNEKYYDRRQVKVPSGRVKRTRPIFPIWKFGTDFELLDDVLNFDELVSIIDLAGRASGLCEARILGYGRFDAKITKVK
jgi:hypothetical protein